MSKFNNQISDDKQDLLELLVDNFLDIIHSVDTNGNIIATNKRATELLGYTKEELLGMNIKDFYAKSILKQVEQGFKYLKEAGHLDHVESRCTTKTGEEIDVEIRSLSLYDKKGEFVKTFSIIRDVRDRKALERQLIQSSKMAALGELASCIVHDINNPLNLISGYNELLGDMLDSGTIDTTELKHIHETINRASAKIQKLTDHLRSFVRSEDITFDKCDLLSIIDNALFLTNDKIMRNNVKVIKEYNVESKVFLTGNANLLEQVFINLFSNACDALDNNPPDRPRCLTLRLTANSQFCKVLVSNTGPKIQKEHLEKIFNPFFTTKPKGKGTGLGLSICSSIMKTHNGQITVFCGDDFGVTFSLKIPLHQEQLRVPLSA